jgi:hypothetical protein
MHRLRYRQVHMDFHTSPAIPDVGAEFEAAQWQAALRRGHVDSVTCFAVCHHGWSYNNTSVGRRHPHLKFDLLRAQFDACREIDVNVPIYITAGVNNRVAEEHPEWREVDADGRYSGWTASPLQAGFRKLCFQTAYTDYLCELIRETVGLFPDCAGIFLDIVHQGPCCCTACLARMEEWGLDAAQEEDRHEMARRSMERYYRMTLEAARSGRPDMPVFHNSGHIRRGQREILPYFSHLEIESLPTGGWGYDHFPLSAKYCQKLDLDFLGMTGKFHGTWGEFGGYKHPNALRYECAAMLAYGAKCSVGDQLHPGGAADESTFDLIGAAYAEVEAKEPWCVEAVNVADVGLLSSEAVHPGRSGRYNAPDEGAARLLLEGQILFDVLDDTMPLAGYRLLILPDDITVDEALKGKLDAYLEQGGQLLLSGDSGRWRDRDEFAFDIGAQDEGLSPFQPDYILPCAALRPDFVRHPLLMNLPSRRIRARSDAESLGAVYDPYFNRDYRHFCSHQHAPPRPEPSGYDCGVRRGALLYLAHPVFSLYRYWGAAACKQVALRAVRWMLGDEIGLRSNLPSSARVTWTRQAGPGRDVLHLLHAAPQSRGGSASELAKGGRIRSPSVVEVIEDVLPLHDVRLSLAVPRAVRQATLEPQGQPLTVTSEQSGRIELTVPVVSVHQMIALQYAEEGV